MRESISSRAFKTFRRVVWISASLLTAAPASALACPVCGFIGTSDNTSAYQAMSAMLTLLPLAMVGAIVWWLTRLATRADTERQSATQPASTPVGGAETDSHSYVVSGFLGLSPVEGSRTERVGADLQIGPQ